MPVRCPIDTRSLNDLISSVPKFNDKMYREYPECSDSRADKTSSSGNKEEGAFVLSGNKLALVQSNQALQDVVERRNTEIAILAKEVDLLRAGQLAAIDKKKKMIEFHGPFLEKLNRKVEESLGFKKIHETACSILTKMNWNIQITSAHTCRNANCTYLPDNVDSDFLEITRATHQKVVTKKLNKLQAKTTKILSSIEKLISSSNLERVQSSITAEHKD